VTRADDIHLDLAEFRLLRELFNEHAGLVFGAETRLVMERRLRERLAALGLSSFSEYYQLLRYDERGRAELEEALDLVTINETYFLREAYQLRAFKDEVLPALRSAPHGRERLSVWSAGCSTGEEVYSIAMLMRESGLFPGRAVRIFGSDISRRVLAHARRGVYGPSAFRAMPLDLKKRYFVDRDDGAHVIDDLRSVCQFGHLNLLDVPRSSIVGRVDVIFCRNVLIYFDDSSRRRVIEMFYDRLLPGGYLLLGHSESLLNVSTAFELVHLREDLVYRKPMTASRFWSSGDFFHRDVTFVDPAVRSTPPMSGPRPAAAFVAVSIRSGVGVEVPGGGADRAPGAGTADRAPGAGAADRAPGAGNADRAPGAGTADRAPGAGTADRPPGAGGSSRAQVPFVTRELSPTLTPKTPRGGST
jgi:chemotaxis protein methyltransferase CheR